MGKLSALRRQESVEKFKWSPFSSKQLDVMSWYIKNPDKNVIIADGAIRSGKTVSMIASFVYWSMHSFNRMNFAICGKTIGSLRRNVISELKKMVVGEYMIEEVRNENLIILAFRLNGKLVINNYYLFGGKDESSQDLVQGITLAGVLFDEVALMPESFVNQATARCSIKNAKMWFNCNPSSPFHWFKLEWLEKLEEKRIHYLHFTMDDNLTLDEDTKDRYKSMYSGVFYDRYIRGLWVLAEGIIYDSFDNNTMVYDEIPVRIKQSWISIDYGTSNATTFILVGLGEDNKIYIMDEFYHSGRDGIKKSPQQYEDELEKWIISIKQNHGVTPKYIYIDPAANYFITQLWINKKISIPIRQADNKVIPGIRMVQSFINSHNFMVNRKCKHVLEELSTYRWDEKAQERGEDKPIKQADHTLDAIRYALFTNKLLMARVLRQHGLIYEESA